MGAQLAYTPSLWQSTFHHIHITHKVDEVLGAGAAGPGKTEALLHDCVPRIYEEQRRITDPDHPHPLRPGHSVGWALHLRRTLPMLKQTIERFRRIATIIDPKVRSWDGGLIWQFQSGYHYEFGHCAEEEDWERYYSNEYDWIGFDELTQFLEVQYDQITARNRKMDPVLSKQLKICAMSNPVARKEKEKFAIRDPQWVRRRFVDREPNGNVVIAREIELSDGSKEYNRVIYLPARLADNPDKEFVKQNDKKLSKLPAHLRKALRDGDWYVTAGSFYAEYWDVRIHVVEPFRIPLDWPVFRSLDWGYKAFGCVGWYALDYDDNLIKFKEWSFRGLTATEAAKEIRAIEQAMKMHLWGGRGSRITGPADTQLWEERGDSREPHAKSKAAMMSECGVHWVRANKARRSNAQLLIGRLKDHRNYTARPGIMFFPDCVNTLRTLPAIQTDDNDPDLPADGGDDHWHDETLYACAHASMGRKGIASRVKEEDDWAEQDRELKVRVTKRGQWGYG